MAKIRQTRWRRLQAGGFKSRGISQSTVFKLVSAHQSAIDRIRKELVAGEGLMGMFHGPVQWQGARYLVAPQQAVKVEMETSMRIEGRRYVPDLIVRCAHTNRLLLVIEVWETHAVSGFKRMAYLAAGIPWIEVRAYKAYARFRKRPLAVLDWGGIAEIEPPSQQDLFASPPWPALIHRAPDRPKHQFAIRSRHWRLPPPLLGALTARPSLA